MTSAAREHVVPVANERTALNIEVGGTTAADAQNSSRHVVRSLVEFVAALLCLLFLLYELMACQMKRVEGDVIPLRDHNDFLRSSEAAPFFGSGTSSSESRIPRMQPFSTINPADAHCPHMDRPQGTWPSDAWGELANTSTNLHTSLPTNAWWENIVLGWPTQVGAGMYRVNSRF